MSNYFCPYCNPKYQFFEKNSEGRIVCGLCGEYITQKRFITFKQIIALVVIFSFTFPFIYILFNSLKKINIYQKRNYQTYEINFTKKI
tara:strand:+ start:7868 stop:8131 length:264 start_codon:yes stop_codon:yes gene_type:complete